MHNSGREELNQADFIDVIHGQQVRAFASIWFFCKFFGFAIWYRCSDAGNIIQRTKNVFIVRNVIDILLYAVLIYTIYLEYMAENCTPVIDSTDGTVTIKVMSKAVFDDSSNCDYDNIFLSKYLLDTKDVMEYHKTHIVLIVFLALKELLIYWQCVRRADAKLKKELETEAGKAQSIVAAGGNDNDGYQRN